MTKQEIEKKIESIESDIFMLEMKDHMTNDDSVQLAQLFVQLAQLFVQLAQLNAEKADLINTLKGMN